MINAPRRGTARHAPRAAEGFAARFPYSVLQLIFVEFVSVRVGFQVQCQVSVVWKALVHPFSEILQRLKAGNYICLLLFCQGFRITRTF